MKPLFILLLLIYSGIVYGQEFPTVDGDVVYELKVENDQLSKQQIFDRTLYFLNNKLNKGSVFVQNSNFDKGVILSRGTTAVDKKGKSQFMYELGLSVRTAFKMEFLVEDGVGKVMIYDIDLIMPKGTGFASAKLTDDIAEGRQYLSSLKEGNLKRKTEKEFAKKVDEINTVFYTVMVLYKREIEAAKSDDNF